MEKFNFGTVNESNCSANRDGKEDEKCPECGKKHGTHSHDEVNEELENPEKADLDKDGKLSGYEKKRGKAIEKSMDNKDGKKDEKNESYRRQVRAMMEEILKIK